MKFGQIIECNMRNIFLEKWYTNCAAGTSPRPFFEKLKMNIISGSLVESFIQFAFIV